MKTTFMALSGCASFIIICAAVEWFQTHGWSNAGIAALFALAAGPLPLLCWRFE